MIRAGIIPDLYLIGISRNFKNWQSAYLDIVTCQECRKRHGEVFNFDVKPPKPEHERCRCIVVPMRTKEAGSATEKGFDGADAWLMYRKMLPNYYITKEEANALGYSRKKQNLADVLPGFMIGGNVFANKQGKLPSSVNRVWREADFDYSYGKRNLKRILYSNDGLIFITEDHYQTFYELTK